MSHQLSASRWSHPSRHSSPAPASTRCSPVPPPSDAERISSGPTSAYHRPLHINSVTGCLPAPPLLNVQPIYATQQSTSIHQLEHSTYQSFLIPQLPAPLAQVPLKQESCSPAAIIPFPDPTIINPVQSLRNSPPLHTVQPSITIHPPEDSTHQNILNRQEPLYLPHGQASTFQTQSHYTHNQSQGMFSGSHGLAFSGNTFIDNSITSDNFMKEFLQHTIIGAEFDSSDRHPPPKCHPGTRLAIMKRCQMFIVQCDGKEKIRWVVGPAGVGKTAIMQGVAEETPADASVFLSVNGRQDGTKVFTTIAYQLATKYEPYRQYVRDEISRDPSILRKSLPAQFRKFMVNPIIHRHLFSPSHRFLIIIDGLDECDNSLTQQELLELIADFCIKYPTSPIVWIVSSRPEPHIISFFDDARVASAYTKEEVETDSNEACEEVQLYLRDELNRIKLASPALRHKREWPSELDYTRIATAAGGLFAYASTVVRYIGDPHYRDPVAQLGRVLETIDDGSMKGVSRSDHPLVQLDALYQRILSNVPADTMINTRKLLLMRSALPSGSFRLTCNQLGLSEAAAYGAVSYIHAVMKAPAPENADDEDLEYFHKSFLEFLYDFKRSGFSHDVEDDAHQLRAQDMYRIVEQVPNDLDSMDRGYAVRCGICGELKSGPRFCDNISLSWPGDERYQISDDHLRLKLYRGAMTGMCIGFFRRIKFYLNMSSFHFLTTRFSVLDSLFPLSHLRGFAFGEFRSKLTELGKLVQVPLRTLDFAAICGRIDVRFRSPIGTDVERFDQWNPSCTHTKVADDLRQWRGWWTAFCRSTAGQGQDATHTDISRFNIQASHQQIAKHNHDPTCLYCSQRFARLLVDNPDQLATVFVDSTEMSYVDLSFVDPDDGVSKWRYRFSHSGAPSSTSNP
ncbi:hypothetical protein Agabi119p4_5321 [Agaricus bisporus var. burnettii]|uniref:NACHT domain-containing protein n=1 Tax=Agaricus bisporus var. burnettii TaxID=192524 RepID=A0A8H7F1J8_AGABI|nr:hypothetical protein Agabi119p4_5321 [Agaricus bisporus var. burnettii]